MKKQFLLLVVMLLPMVASAYDAKIDNIFYNLNATEKTAEVTNNGQGGTSYYYMYKDDLVIPETVTHEGVTYTVTRVGDEACYTCFGLTSVSIPKTVKEIGEDAFYSCSYLTSVTLCEGLVKIGKFAFGECAKVTSFSIPSTVTEIGDYAFAKCHALTSFIIPSTVTKIGDSTFWQCKNMTSITIPDDVTSIGTCAFQDCMGLTSITIPSKVTSIGKNAFVGCTALTRVNISNLAGWCSISFDSDETNPLYYAHHLYLNGEEVKELVVPNGVTKVSARAFVGATSLTSVTIPGSVTLIGEGAFQGCTALTSATLSEGLTQMEYMSFAECPGLTEMVIPNSVTILSSSVFESCSGLKSVTIGSGIEDLYWGVFTYCTALTEVYCLAESVPYTYHAFEDFNIKNATLYVPAVALEAYKANDSWNKFKQILPISSKLSTPVISVVGGKLKIEGNTTGVTYKTTYNYVDAKTDVKDGEIVLGGTFTCHISVIASKEGLEDSDPAEIDVELSVGPQGDVNHDGNVSITDAVSVVNQILNNE